MDRSQIKLVVLLGPTASGKSDLAIRLAKQFNGEIVSADSRQVYTGLDLGTGKVTKRERREVPHHLLDVALPPKRWRGGQQPFTLADYKIKADEAIFGISKRGKVPFLVGGTALYIDAVVRNFDLPPAVFDPAYREQLEKKSTDRLAALLAESDPQSYAAIDVCNRRRLIRALEVVRATGRSFVAQKQQGRDRYQSLILGIDLPRQTLYARIDERIKTRTRKGLIGEVRRLHAMGVSKKWLSSLGLEYRFLSEYLEKEASLTARERCAALEETLARLAFATHDFARRQLTWWRRNPDICWIRNEKDALSHVRHFLRKGNG